MEKVVINDSKINDSDVQVTLKKVRAILVNGDNVLITYYGGLVLFPGGSIEEGETTEEALVRELKEETGLDYDSSQLKPFLKLVHYQKRFPTIDGPELNRKVETFGAHELRNLVTVFDDKYAPFAS